VTAFDGYVVEGRVASTSGAVVWKAGDPRLGRTVAIKQLVADTPQMRDLWRAEARTLAMLDSPHIVTVYDLVEDDSGVYLVEEWIDGASLGAVFTKSGNLTEEQAVGIARGALLGLVHAHERGVIHRDVSLGNILVDMTGTSKLIDFGLADPAAVAQSSGTKAYASPEVVAGLPAGPAADVYSVAAVLAHLIQGRPPASATDLGGVWVGLRQVLALALAPDPALRHADARSLLVLLDSEAVSHLGVDWEQRASIAALVPLVGLTTLVAAAVPAAMSGSHTPAPGPGLFFERQRVARNSSTARVVYFICGVAGTIVPAIAIASVVVPHLPLTDKHAQRVHWTAGELRTWIIAVAVSVVLFVLARVAWTTLKLRFAGGMLARRIGATRIDARTTLPVYRRYVHVVEEMSIASGVPVPRLYVLEREQGINAFAAGYTPADAAICVTAGALKALNRDELQAVVAHEFSHILNGDVRLNTRLSAWLNAIGNIGASFSRVPEHLGLKRTGPEGQRTFDPYWAGFGLVVGGPLWVVGLPGRIFAALMSASASRQREWLADASAIQFTRAPIGLIGALKKIAGVPLGSRITDPTAATQVAHMSFGPAKRLRVPYASHPPILERIRALDPGFDTRELADARQLYAGKLPDGLAEDVLLGFAEPADTSAPDTPGRSIGLASAAGGSVVGTITGQTVDLGRQLSAEIPSRLRDLAIDPATASALVVATLLDPNPDAARAQYTVVHERLGRDALAMAARLSPEMAAVSPVIRLPIVMLALPQVAAGSDSQRQAVAATVDALVASDGAVTLSNYCLAHVVRTYLGDVAGPRRRTRPAATARSSFTPAALQLIAAVAVAGNASPADAERAFAAAGQRLLGVRPTSFDPPTSPSQLDTVWPILDALQPIEKRPLVDALLVAVKNDGVLTVAEADLLRITCAALQVPIPTLIE